MKIVYFYQFFSSPKGSWGTRVYELGRRWVARGHEVTVVTSIFYKSDLEATGLVSEQSFDGIRVKILNVRISNKHSFLKRVWTFLLYSVLSTWYALRLPADVVIASSGPITVGLPGLVARYLRRRRLVFEVRDLWPEGAIELGVLKNPLLKWLSFRLEKACYRAASLIVTLSPGMADHIARKHGLTHALSVPNAADNVLFGNEAATLVRPEWAVGRKLAIYTGNIGAVNHSGYLFAAAEILAARGNEEIMILLIGDGQLRESLARRIAETGLENIRILGLMPKGELVAWVRAAMVSLVPLKGTPILDTSSPNKLFDSLAAGVPVIQTTGGWIRDFLEEERCGYTVDPERPEELADLLVALAGDEPTRATMGENAARLARSRFDKIILADRMLAGLERVAAGGPRDRFQPGEMA